MLLIFNQVSVALKNKKLINLRSLTLYYPWTLGDNKNRISA